jgi:OFA family oxalate/formate antiporter-like MFS transporter
MKYTRSRHPALFSIVGCLLVQLCVGIIYLWSVLKSPVAVSFGMSEAAAGMISSYMLTAFVCGGLLGGLATDRLGPRITCICGVCLFACGIAASALLTGDTASLLAATYAGAGGLGSGVAYSACISCIQKWMPEKRGLASGLAISAFGLSTVVFAPVFRALMTAFTGVDGLVCFPPVFLILGGLFLVLGLLGCALIRRPPEAAPAAGAGADVTLRQAVRTLPFWCIVLTIFFINGAWNLATPLIYDLGLARGLTPALATFALSFTGVANAAGRLSMAALSDKLGRPGATCILAVMTILASLAMLSAHAAGYIAVVSILAFAYGGPSAVNAAFVSDCFGSRHSASIYGVMLLALGASSLFFNTIAARLFSGDVTATFLMAAGSAVVPLVLMAVFQHHAHAAEKRRAVGPLQPHHN